MKVKFRFGIKSYSGTVDDFNYANFPDRNVVIGRMVPESREITTQNEVIGNTSNKIAQFYSQVSSAYKQDLELYSLKLYKQKEYQGQLAGNKYSSFTKIMWAASKDPDLPVNLDALNIDDANLGSYDNILTVKTAVEKGYLPKIDGYEELTANIHA